MPKEYFFRKGDELIVWSKPELLKGPNAAHYYERCYAIAESDLEVGGLAVASLRRNDDDSYVNFNYNFDRFELVRENHHESDLDDAFADGFDAAVDLIFKDSTIHAPVKAEIIRAWKKHKPSRKESP